MHQIIRSISDCVMPRKLTCTALIRVCDSKLNYSAVVPRHMDASTPVCCGCPGYQMIRWQGTTKTVNSISARHRPKTANVSLAHYVRRHCITLPLQSPMRHEHIPRGIAFTCEARKPSLMALSKYWRKEHWRLHEY